MSRKLSDLSAAEVAAELAYNPDTGVITRKNGKPLGGRAYVGYRRFRVCGVEVQAHRVAWVLAHGEWPTNSIDHINGDRADNRLANLRDVLPSVNGKNMRARAGNAAGFPGVTVDPRDRPNKFIARIRVDSRLIWLGAFKTAEEAHEAYRSACKRYGFGPSHGLCTPEAHSLAAFRRAHFSPCHDSGFYAVTGAE